METLPNYDNFKKLWDLFTTEGGRTPEMAAAELGNIYAESKANPYARNPDDGGPGHDSVGIIQWNRGRLSRLERFANERDKSINDLEVQARYWLEETATAERGNYAKIDQSGDVGQMATQLAQHVIRPAAEHIPQRAQYAKAMYDIFHHGKPVKNMLAYNEGHAQTQAASRDQELADPDRLRYNLPDDGLNEEAILAQLSERFGAPHTPEAMYTPPLLEEPSGQVEQPMPSGEPITVPRMPPTHFRDADNGGFAEMFGLPTQKTSPNQGDNLPQVDKNSAPKKPLDDTIEKFQGVDPEALDDEAIDLRYPAEDDERPTSEIFNDLMQTAGTGAALDMGVAPENVREVVPATTSQAVEAVQAPPPDETTDEEEAKIREQRRLVAAHMLETLSVGLGQMSRGEAVSLGDTLRGQRAQWEGRARIEQEEQQRRAALEQQQRAATGLAQQLVSAGAPQLAQLALSGPEGYKQAAQAAGDIFKTRATQGQTFAGLNPKQRYETLRLQGIDEQTAAIGAQFPDLGAAFLEQSATERMSNAGAEEEAAGLIAQAMPYINNPAVLVAADRVMRNPTTENNNLLHDAIVESGGEVRPKLSNDTIEMLAKRGGIPLDSDAVRLAKEGDPAAQDIITTAASNAAEYGGREIGKQRAVAQVQQEQANELVQTGILTPSEGKIAEAEGVDVALEARKARYEQEQKEAERKAAKQLAKTIYQTVPDNIKPLFTDVQDYEGLRIAMQQAGEAGLTEEVKTALQVMGDPKLKRALIEVNSAKVGKTLSATQEGLLNSELKRQAAAIDAQTGATQMVEAMRTLKEVVSAEGYDGGGPISGTVGVLLQNVATDLFGEQAADSIIQSGDLFGMRMVEAIAGEYFSHFRATGSGATSDFDAKKYLAGMPQKERAAFQQAGMAQRLIREYELQEVRINRAQEWMLKNDGKPETQLDRQAMQEYIDKGVEESGIEIYPTINIGAEDNGMSDIVRHMKSATGLSDNTVIRVVRPDGQPVFMYFRDLSNPEVMKGFKQ